MQGGTPGVGHQSWQLEVLPPVKMQKQMEEDFSCTKFIMRHGTKEKIHCCCVKTEPPKSQLYSNPSLFVATVATTNQLMWIMWWRKNLDGVNCFGIWVAQNQKERHATSTTITSVCCIFFNICYNDNSINFKSLCEDKTQIQHYV